MDLRHHPQRWQRGHRSQRFLEQVRLVTFPLCFVLCSLSLSLSLPLDLSLSLSLSRSLSRSPSHTYTYTNSPFACLSSFPALSLIIFCFLASFSLSLFLCTGVVLSPFPILLRCNGLNRFAFALVACACVFIHLMCCALVACVCLHPLDVCACGRRLCNVPRGWI